MSCATEAPSCLPPQGTLLFFPGTVGPAGPAGVAGPVGPAGIAGPHGPIGVYVGTFVVGGTYYDTVFRQDIVDYAGQLWVVSNPAKSGMNTWAAPNVEDWDNFGAIPVFVATMLRLLYPADISVGINLSEPGYIKSNNYVQFVSGSLFSWTGRLESYDALIAGQISTDTPRFNLASVNRTMPATAMVEYDIPALTDGDITVNPIILNVTSNALIFFGWLQGANNFIENRFGNNSQKFFVSLSGIGANISAGTDLFYIQLYYRTRINGGSWDPLPTPFGQGAYMQKLASNDQSFQVSAPLTISLLGTQDIQFSAGFSKGVGGTVSVGGAKISVQAFN